MKNAEMESTTSPTLSARPNSFRILFVPFNDDAWIGWFTLDKILKEFLSKDTPFYRCGMLCITREMAKSREDTLNKSFLLALLKF